MGNVNDYVYSTCSGMCGSLYRMNDPPSIVGIIANDKSICKSPTIEVHHFLYKSIPQVSGTSMAIIPINIEIYLLVASDTLTYFMRTYIGMDFESSPHTFLYNLLISIYNWFMILKCITLAKELESSM